MIRRIFLLLLSLLSYFCPHSIFVLPISETQFDALNPPVNVSNILSYFAICAVVKNEIKEDLREWVEYHRRMGCGKFYIHDNGINSVKVILEDYVQLGLVDVLIRSDTAPQLSVYHNCLRKYRTYHRWIGLIDADEFIVTKDACSIPSVLKRYEGYGGLTLNWKIFCSSGHRKRPEGATLQNYWTCYNFDHVKTIANTDYAVSHYGNPHTCQYSHGKFAIDTDFQKVKRPMHAPRPTLYTVMYINHYHLKSKEDYDRNRKRGRASTRERGRKTEKYFWEVDSLCRRNCSILTMPPESQKDCPLETFGEKPLEDD